MPVTYQTNPIIALTFVSFKEKKVSFDSLMESGMTIFPYQFLIKTLNGLCELGPTYFKNALNSFVIYFR